MWIRQLLLSIVVMSALGALGAQLRLPSAGRRVDLQQPVRDTQSLRDAELVSKLNDEFRQHWQQRGLPPADTAPSLQVIRRLALGLTGTIPSLEELRLLQRIPESDQVDWYLGRLLQDRRTSDYLAERLARAFVGAEDGPFIVFRRQRFVTWLSDQLLANRPYDEIARSLISDEGIWTDSPSINYITVTNDTNEEGQPDPIRLAARTTRAFLGVRLDCVQCHDDNLGGDWLQSDFHELAAYFSEARTSGLGIRDMARDYEYQYLDSEQTEVIEPSVPFATELTEQQSGTRREQLAAWATHPENLAFSRTAVNRMWALLFGRPLVDPIDSIPLDGPYPPGLELLAQDFAEHGFQLQRLIANIVGSEVFQLQSRHAGLESAPQADDWLTFPLTRLRPEQMAGAVVQAASLTTIDSESHVMARIIKYAQIGDFVKRYGDIGEDEFQQRAGTIPQRLVMLNGDLVKERTKDDIANAATRIADQVDDDDRAIELAYDIVLTRKPSERELQFFRSLLQQDAAEIDRKARLEDLVWALVNSAEFCWNH